MNSIGISEDLHSITQIVTRAGKDSRAITVEAADMLENLSNVLLSNNSRKTIDGHVGKWVTVKKANAAYFALVDLNYPERVGYKALDEADETYRQFLENHNLSALKAKLNSILEKYIRPEEFDRLAQANRNVDDLVVNVQGNLDKLVKGDENLNELDENARKLHQEAQTYNKNANSLKKTLWWRNVWFWVMIAALVIGIVILIVLLAKLT